MVNAAASKIEQKPSRASIPYGLHLIEEDDIHAVCDALRSGLLAQGPRVERFESAFSQAVQAPHAVACSSGTASLHLAMAALDISKDDICIVPSITFLSTATAALYCGAAVLFADVDPITGLMTADTLREAIMRAGPRAKLAVPVHLGGRACDMRAISEIARKANILLIEDACHALGTIDGDLTVGSAAYSSAATFSFHPVKTIACGEGGMVTTGSRVIAERIRSLRNHGVTRDPTLMEDAVLSFDGAGRPNPWSYEQVELGFNYRMTEMEGALGFSQLGKLDRFVDRRALLASRYDHLLSPLRPFVRPVIDPAGQQVSKHLYSVHIDFGLLGLDKAKLIRDLAVAGIGTQVHYIPVYRQPHFVRLYGPQFLPGAEAYYATSLTLPLFPAMNDIDVDRTVLELTRALGIQ
jgi:UDP-4-amino-4,6-dideoxy-N-acetyl-beta-L-altrosamine transaminase